MPVFDKLFGQDKDEEPDGRQFVVSSPPIRSRELPTSKAEKRYAPGERIVDRYEVVKVLAGGMGVVYLCADHAEEGHPVALKTFKPKFLPDRTTRDRFLREGTIWVGLGHHPHIVQAYRVERLKSGLEIYLVLEWVAQAEGKDDASLRAWIQPGQPLSFNRSLLLALHIARGMKYAVTKIPGLVHHDLKPENVLVGRDGNARVTDFGLASVLASLREQIWQTDSKGKRAAGGGVGTPLYMAPEQWKRRATVDARADIYAFGCILYEMLTGYSVVAGKDPDELAEAHLFGRLREIPADFPAELKALVRGCLTLKAEDRFQNWGDVEFAVGLVYSRVVGKETPPLEEDDNQTNPRSGRIAAGWSYDAMGLSYYDIGNYDLAAGYFERVIWLARTEEDRALEGAGLNHLGDACLAMGDLKGAIEFYDQHLSIARQIGDRPGESDALGNLGKAHTALNDLKRAMIYYEEQLAITQEFDDQARLGQALSNLGDACRELGHIQEAIDAYKRSLALTQKIEDRLKEGRILGNLGLAYATLGRTQYAIQCYEQALKIAKNVGDRTGEGYAMRNLGHIHHDLGDLQKAIWFLINYLVVAQETRDRVGEQKTLYHLGDIYLEVDNVEQAIESYQAALIIARKIGDQAWLGKNLSGLGYAYARQGTLGRAIGFYEESLTLMQKIGDQAQVGEIAYRLGNVYRQTDDLQRARQRYEQALTAARQTGNEEMRANIDFDFAISLAREGRRDEALHYAELAEYMYKQLQKKEMAKKAKDLIAKLRSRRKWF